LHHDWIIQNTEV